jgi:hypothetical protein
VPQDGKSRAPAAWPRHNAPSNVSFSAYVSALPRPRRHTTRTPYSYTTRNCCAVPQLSYLLPLLSSTLFFSPFRSLTPHEALSFHKNASEHALHFPRSKAHKCSPPLPGTSTGFPRSSCVSWATEWILFFGCYFDNLPHFFDACERMKRMRQ